MFSLDNFFCLTVAPLHGNLFWRERKAREENINTNELKDVTKNPEKEDEDERGSLDEYDLENYDSDNNKEGNNEITVRGC